MASDSSGALPQEHPMVSVPDAIRTVLYQTALVLLDGQKYEKKLSSSWQDLLHQTLDETVFMKAPGYPAYRASIMDGYAIRTKDDFTPGKEWTHAVRDKVFAGDDIKTDAIEPSETVDGLPAAYYITTGAVVPDTFDCVIPIEKCAVSPDQSKISVQPSAVVEKHKWIRPVGCDIPAGSVVLERGHLLDPASVGILKQTGMDEVMVRPSIKVGVLSTGNELLHPDQDGNQVGLIPDVNRPILLSILSTLGPWCHPIDLGIRRDDDMEALTSALQSALEECDIIISSGGISKGETDVMEDVLVKKLGGKLHFGRLHMKPGKPTTFVTIPSGKHTRLFFAMPGNPVSATVCTLLLVKPCLHLLYNGPVNDDTAYRIVENAWLHPEITATITHNSKLDKERPEYQRVTLKLTKDGKYQATSTGVQRSSRLVSMRGAQGLLMLPQGIPGGKMTALAGEEYTVLLLYDDPLRRVRVCDSLHLNREAHKSFRISIVHVVSLTTMESEETLKNTSNTIAAALSGGATSGSAKIVSAHSYAGDATGLFDFMKKEEAADVIVVACASFSGSFRSHLNISSELRQRLDKVADSLALQVRRGAALEDPTAALFETVVGYLPHGRGAMVVCLPESGLKGALENTRGLLKHALYVARSSGQEGNDHSHQ